MSCFCLLHTKSPLFHVSMVHKQHICQQWLPCGLLDTLVQAIAYCSQCPQQVHSILFTISAGQHMVHTRHMETNLKPASCGSCSDACCFKAGCLLTFEGVCMPAGDYWPGEAENLLGNISEEARQAGRKGNKGSLTAGGKPRAKSTKVPTPPSRHTECC